VKPSIVTRLSAISDRVVVIERATCGLLVAGVLLLIVLNVVTRAFNIALYWVDELAVYGMIWMAFLGASVLIRHRKHVGITLLAGSLTQPSRHYFAILSHSLVLLFAVSLVVMSAVWFSPVELARHGFDTGAFTSSTFNFIYKEPTNTLGIQKFWLWLVIPIAAITMTLHATANLCEEIAGAKKQAC
jgi:TRAP-type C4-dicarboxylate transport system permease small subunit